MSPASSASSSSIGVRKTQNCSFSQKKMKNQPPENESYCIGGSINFYNNDFHYQQEPKNLLKKNTWQSANHIENLIDDATITSKTVTGTNHKYQKSHQSNHGRWAKSGSGKWRRVNNISELSRSHSVDRFSLMMNKRKSFSLYIYNLINAL